MLPLLTSCDRSGKTVSDYSKSPSQDYAHEMNWKFAYDEDGRLLKSTDPGGKLCEFLYAFADSARQVLTSLIRRNADGDVSLHFDRFGRLECMKDVAGSLCYGYDGFSRVTSVKRNNDHAIAYTYNALDQLTSYTIDDNFAIEYEYDFLGRLKTMKTPAGNISYEYWSGQSTVKRTLPNTISTYWKFSPDGKLESIEHVNKANAVLCKYEYWYNADGLISEITEWSPKGARILKYGYDVVKRLVSYECSDGEKTVYSYDRIGNRTSVMTNGELKQCAEFDGVGKMISCNGQKCSYDASGNLTSYGNADKKASYKYDASNKLQEANGVSYTYDGSGNLISRNFDGQQSTFFPDPFCEIWKPLAATNGAKKSYYIWEREHPLAVVEDGKVNFLLEDNLASVRSVVDMHGTSSGFFSFSPFGVPSNSNGSPTLVPSFTGLFFDTQTELFPTRNRAFSPSYGRFLQIDPLHQIPSGHQANASFYAYCGANPINFHDRNGMQPSFFNPVWRNAFFNSFSYETHKSWNAFSNSVNNNLIWLRAFSGSFAHETHNSWIWWSSFLNSYNTYMLPWNLGVSAEYAKKSYASWSAQNQSYSSLLNAIGGYIPGKGGNSGQEQFSHLWAFVPGRDLGSALIDYQQGHPFVAAFEMVTGLAPFASKVAKYFAKNAQALNATASHLGQLPLLESSGQYHFSFMSRQFQNEINQLIKSAHSVETWGNRIKTWGNQIEQLDNYHKVFEILEGEAYGSQSASDIVPSNVGGVYLGGVGKNVGGLCNISGVAHDKTTDRIILLGNNKPEFALPTLRVQDVVTIFRAVYNGEAPYVSIDPDPKNPHGNIMLTRHSESTINTYVAWVLFQADRIMKSYSLSRDNETQQLINSKVPGYKEILDEGFAGTEYGKNIWTRFWIVPGDVKQSLSVGEDVSLYDMDLKVNTQQMKMQQGKLVPAENEAPAKASKDFAAWFTRSFNAIAEEALCEPPAGSGITGRIAVFKELRRIALITAIAENLRDKGVPFPFWMRDYKVKPLTTPATTPAITVENRRDRVIHRVYGGVNLSGSTSNTTVYKNDPVANKIATVIKDLATRPLLEPLQLPINNASTTTAVALPGAETKALAPCTLQETDLQVPLKHGDFISLERHYNSFFNTADIFGDGWTLDLPKLEQQKMPYDKTEESVKFNIRQNILTPLNSINATGIKVYEGKNSNIGYKTSMVILPENTRLHFDANGNLVGIENSGLTTVYKRGKNQRMERIEGWYCRNLEAHIDLTYSREGKVIRAEGSNEESIDYSYDDDGNLVKTVWTSGKETTESVKYTYSNKMIEQIFRNDKLIKHFAYKANGQLLKEINADKSEVNYQMNIGNKNYKLVSSGGNGATVVEYNAAYMPTRVHCADNSAINWTYNADHSVNALLLTSTGKQYKMTYSADGRNRSLQLPEGGMMESQLDSNGRLLTLKKNGELVLQQAWRQDGSLAYTQYGSTIVQTEYNQQGERVRTLTGIKSADNSFSDWAEDIFDKDGNIVKQNDYSGKAVSYKYSAGELSKIVINKNEISIRRDGDGKIERIKTPWGEQAYDYKKGKLEKVEITTGKFKDEMSFIDELPSFITQSDAGKWQFSYYPKSRGQILCEIKAPNNLFFNYKYDEQNRLASATVKGQFGNVYEWDEKGRLVGIKISY